MFQELLTSRRFVPIFICQFFSALSDNFIKNALVILILFKLGTTEGGALVTLAGAALIMPMFILSALGGELADRYDKARVARLPTFCCAKAGLSWPMTMSVKLV